MAKNSLLPRSMKWLRDRGFICCRVEQRLFMPKAKFPVTRDAFGFGDLLAAKRYFGTILVQVTSRGNALARIKKITQPPKEGDENVLELATRWLEAEGSIYVHGWVKRGRPPRWKMVAWRIDFDMDGKLAAFEIKGLQ
jgi:hypothetical protein